MEFWTQSNYAISSSVACFSSVDTRRGLLCLNLVHTAHHRFTSHTMGTFYEQKESNWEAFTASCDLCLCLLKKNYLKPINLAFLLTSQPSCPLTLTVTLWWHSDSGTINRFSPGFRRQSISWRMFRFEHHQENVFGRPPRREEKMPVRKRI